MQFTVVACILVCIYAYSMYLSQLIGLDWRSSLTSYLKIKWLSHTGKCSVDNPDQRIAEDVNKFVNSIILTISTLLQQVVFLVIFSIITYKLSGDLFHVSGLLLWVSLGYALLGSLATYFIGKPLVKIEFETQKREADFRYGLALERTEPSGDNSEMLVHWSRYANLKEMLIISFRRQKLVNFFVSGYNQIEVVVPFLFIAPSYFASALTLGWLMQTAQSMSMVQQSVSYVVNNYSQLAQLQATMNRLTIFNEQLGGS